MHNLSGRFAALRPAWWPLCAALLVPPALAQSEAATVVYRCPGNVYTSDRELSTEQAAQRGCKVIEGAPVTVMQTTRPRAPAAAVAPAASVPQARVEPGLQRQRDNDARRILTEELRREEQRLAELQREYNGGSPERRGDERNYQRYLDRVAEMKDAITRKEADIAAIKRELGKLPPL